MTICRGVDKIISLDARGLFGFSSTFGLGCFGRILFGVPDDYTGVYQRRLTRTGREVSRGAQYGRTNLDSPGVQARNTLFRAGMSAWASLTPEQRKRYDVRARRLGVYGCNVFMREYLRNPTV